MKIHFSGFFGPFLAAIMLFSCDSGLVVKRYSLELPDIPPAWASVLGRPHWRIEWTNIEGRKETLDMLPGTKTEITLPHTWTNALLAWPYWPKKDIHAGTFKPAGGLFPFDAAGTSFIASWQGGVDAFLYRELGKASVKYSGAQTTVPRLPWNFNWPRFRELRNDSEVNAEFRADPWLVDWPAIAEKIWQSGFAKRRLVPPARVELTIPVLRGPWTTTSPFAAPRYFTGIPVFTVRAADREKVDIWVCADGILRCNSNVWIFSEW